MAKKSIFLENVAHLKRLDECRTWKTIEHKLNDMGYEVDIDICELLRPTKETL